MSKPDPQTTLDEMKVAIQNYLDVKEDFKNFDGDRRGIAGALVRRENVLRRLIGYEEIEDEA